MFMIKKFNAFNLNDLEKIFASAVLIDTKNVFYMNILSDVKSL